MVLLLPEFYLQYQSAVNGVVGHAGDQQQMKFADNKDIGNIEEYYMNNSTVKSTTIYNRAEWIGKRVGRLRGIDLSHLTAI